MTLLAIKNLTISFVAKQGLHKVVSNVSFSIEKSSCVGLVGESGSGKSLTALSIMQLLPVAARVATKSEILFSDVNLLNQTERKMRDYRGKKIGMIFQDSMAAFNPVLTIAAQMDEVLKKNAKLSQKMRREQALMLLNKVGIKEVARCYHAYPHQLSGGMRQRAMIAMALLPEPELIIADEPTTALDVTIQTQVLDLLLALREKEQLTLLFITHDLAVASKMADHVVVMQRGEVIEKNSAREFFQAPQHEYSKKLLASIPDLTPRQVCSTQTPEIIAVRDLKVYFPTKAGRWWPSKHWVKAVDGIDFTIERGKTLALVGESGSGKTTVARAMIQLVRPTAGQVLLDHHDLCRYRGTSLRKMRKDIQIIFQDPYVSLNPRRMVADSIAEGIRAQKLISDRAAQIACVDEVLQQVGLSPECKWRYPHEFSGGEKQRICIARAIALRPQLLILDEPTSALDVSIQMQVLQLLESLQKQYNISYLLITHDLAVVAYLAHSVVVMYQGRMVESGDTSTVLQNPQQAYTKKLASGVFNVSR